MKFRAMKLLFLLFVILFQTSCQRWVANILPSRPSKEFKKDLLEATPDFVKGWEDGCETAMSTGNTFYRLFYRSNKVDGYKMSSSSDYKSAWGSAFWYCHRHDYIKQKSPIWGSMFAGYQ